MKRDQKLKKLDIHICKAKLLRDYDCPSPEACIKCSIPKEANKFFTDTKTRINTKEIDMEKLLLSTKEELIEKTNTFIERVSINPVFLLIDILTGGLIILGLVKLIR